jgi:hypothetical protein
MIRWKVQIKWLCYDWRYSKRSIFKARGALTCSVRQGGLKDTRGKRRSYSRDSTRDAIRYEAPDSRACFALLAICYRPPHVHPLVSLTGPSNVWLSRGDSTYSTAEFLLRNSSYVAACVAANDDGVSGLCIQVSQQLGKLPSLSFRVSSSWVSRIRCDLMFSRRWVSPWRWWLWAPLKRRSISSRLHCPISQKAAIFTESLGLVSSS